MTIAQFDSFDTVRKRDLLYECCPSEAWVKEMLSIFPVQDLIDLLEYAEEKWYDCNPAEWQEAFFNRSASAKQGDAAVTASLYSQNTTISPDMQEAMEKANTEYMETFGYPYIVFAEGKTPEELLSLIHERMGNNSHDELLVAAAEQDKITKWRLQQILQ